MAITIPERLRAAWSEEPGSRAWMERLPGVVDELRERWSLSLGEPFDGEATGAWVVPALQADGTRAVLKLGLPHMEAEHEIQGLRYWDSDPTVRLLAADEELNALLLERCEPAARLLAP